MRTPPYRPQRQPMSAAQGTAQSAMRESGESVAFRLSSPTVGPFVTTYPPTFRLKAR